MKIIMLIIPRTVCYIHIKKNEPQSDFFWQTIDLQRLPGTTVLRGSAVKPNINASGDFTGGCGIEKMAYVRWSLFQTKTV